MPAKVTLQVIQGKLRGQEFVFDERTTCIVGKVDDCHPRLPLDKDHHTISRHHCLLDINPPDIRVRDFGSLNGTHVNGHVIGRRDRGETPAEGAQVRFPEHDLKDGDEIRLGKTVLRVRIIVPVTCSCCGVEIPEGREAEAVRAPGVHQCRDCRARARAAPPPGKKCARCDKDVSAEAGANRRGDFICTACKANPGQVLGQMLEQANSGRKDLLGIQGYRVLKELGQGGMGAVYLARHEKTGAEVALKVMLPKIAAEERAKQTFLREAANMKVLRHPNVVQLHDVGCSAGTFFITLEYCDGGSAHDLLRQRGGTLPLREAAPIIMQALDGLDYAHNVQVSKTGGGKAIHGLVHRDLKPHNLFLSGSGNSRIAKVGDFGLAKAFDLAGLSGQTCTGSAAGTPHFMPRQQVSDFKYARPDVDVWALAATFYFLLTGKVPRDFSRGRDPWYIVLREAPVQIRRRDATIPPKLAAVLDLALDDQKGLHFRTAAELKRALEGVI